MIWYGSNIQSPADRLEKLQEAQLYHRLRNPKPHTASTMQQLRTVYTIDARRYAELKRTLPYVVCATFNPPFRLGDNFAFTERFILDFDHLASKQLDISQLRQRLCHDSRVMLCFTSPSQDGLKVMLSLKERCYDRGLYTLFYKAFAAQFARQMGLDQVLDQRTADVTRACFLSIDPDAYYNPDAEPVDMKTFIDADQPLAIADMKRDQDKAARQQPAPQQPRPSDPTGEAMQAIREKLLGHPVKPEPKAYVPPQLDDLIGPLTDYIQQTGIVVSEIINIQYAKKIRAKLGLRQAEINLFYGRRSYSVVVSPRRGTDDELNQLLADLTHAFLADPSLLPY